MRVTPMAMDLIKKKNVSIEKILGSGESGKITVYDIERFLKPKRFKFGDQNLRKTRQKAVIESQEVSEKKIETSSYPEVSKLPTLNDEVSQIISKMNKIELGLNSKQHVPHFAVKSEINLEAAFSIIEYMNRTQNKPDDRITLTELILKAVNISILKNKDFQVFSFESTKYLKSSISAIEYSNLIDLQDRRSFEFDKPQNFSAYKKNQVKKSILPNMLVVDGSQTIVRSLQPVLSYRNVNLSERSFGDRFYCEEYFTRF